MSDTSGHMSGTPLAQYDPEQRCWKTSEATSLWALPMSSLTLPTWGGLHAGVLYELPTPARPTIEPGCSSLPTPVADNSRGLPNGGDYQSLPNTVMRLPTPRAQNGEPRNQTIWRRPLDQPQNLENALALLPTPAVNDMGAGKDPQAWDEWAARQKAADGRPAPHGKSLEQEALRMLPTPQAGDGFGQNDNLNNQRAHKTSPYGDLPRSVAQNLLGATTPPPSTAGSTSLDEPHQAQLFSATSETD